MANKQPRECPESFKIFTLLPDCTKHCAADLARMYGVNQATLSRRARSKDRKTVYTRQELQEWREKLDAGGDVRTKKLVEKPRPLSIDDIEYKPCLAERSMLRL